MPPIPKKKPKPPDDPSFCRACSGTGKSSRGMACHPCSGTGKLSLWVCPSCGTKYWGFRWLVCSNEKCPSNREAK